MAEIKLYKSTKKGLKVIVLAIPFLFLGIWLINKEPFEQKDYIIGWLSTCFFGLGIPLGLFHTFDKRPQIIINEDGIWDRTTNQEEIKWEQIVSAYPSHIMSQKFISLKTDETFILKKKLYKWASELNKTMGTQSLSLGQIKIDVNLLANFINKMTKTKKEDRGNLIQEFNNRLKTQF